MAVELPAEYRVAGVRDGVDLVPGQLAQASVRDGGGLLDRREGEDHLDRHDFAPDAEVFERTLGLRAPEPVRGDADLAHAVPLDPVVHVRFPLA